MLDIFEISPFDEDELEKLKTDIVDEVIHAYFNLVMGKSNEEIEYSIFPDKD